MGKPGYEAIPYYVNNPRRAYARVAVVGLYIYVSLRKLLHTSFASLKLGIMGFFVAF